MLDRFRALADPPPTSFDFSCDLALSRSLAGIEVAFYSGEGLTHAEALDFAYTARAQGAGTAVVTLASAGSIGVDARGHAIVPAHSIDVIDTCGAGDAYIAAFIDRRVSGADLTTCMRAGATDAAAACQRRGAVPQRMVRP